MREVLSPKNRAGLDCPRIIRMIVNCESNLFAELSRCHLYDSDNIRDAKKPGPLARYRVVPKMVGAGRRYRQAPALSSALLKVALGRITALTLVLSGL
jgi:hypothetical protein